MRERKKIQDKLDSSGDYTEGFLKRTYVEVIVEVLLDIRDLLQEKKN